MVAPEPGRPGPEWGPGGDLGRPSECRSHQPGPDRAATCEGPFGKDELWRVRGGLSWAGSRDAE